MFSQRLREILRERGKTATWLAQQSGVPVGNVSRYLSGERKPTYDNLLAIAIALKIPLDRLTQRKDLDDQARLADIASGVVDRVRSELGIGPTPKEETSREVPVLGGVPGRLPVTFTREGYVKEGKPEYLIPRTRMDDPHAFAVYALDNSYCSTIREGWEATASPTEPWKDGDVVLVRPEDGNDDIRQIHDIGRSFLLISLRTGDKPVTMPKKQIRYIWKITSIHPKAAPGGKP